MTNTDIKKHMDMLVKELNQHNYKYYVLAQPTISDFEFDKKLAELVELEKKHGSHPRNGTMVSEYMLRPFLSDDSILKITGLKGLAGCSKMSVWKSQPLKIFYPRTVKHNIKFFSEGW